MPFKTETFRPWGCMKGIFTRERQPKAAAHLVRWRYWMLAIEEGAPRNQIAADVRNPYWYNV